MKSGTDNVQGKFHYVYLYIKKELTLRFRFNSYKSNFKVYSYHVREYRVLIKPPIAVHCSVKEFGTWNRWRNPA